MTTDRQKANVLEFIYLNANGKADGPCVAVPAVYVCKSKI